MAFLIPILSFTVGLLGLVQAEPLQSSATDVPIGNFYGYGKNISGLPLFVANGTAYLGNVTLSPLPDAANLTFRFVAAEGQIIADYQLTNSSGTTTNSTDNYFSIDTSSGASNPVLIQGSTNGTAYTTENFAVYGSQIMWRDPNATIPGTMSSSFYAVQDGVEHLWKVYWDADGNAGKKGNLIVLKNV